MRSKKNLIKQTDISCRVLHDMIIYAVIKGCDVCEWKRFGLQGENFCKNWPKTTLMPASSLLKIMWLRQKTAGKNVLRTDETKISLFFFCLKDTFCALKRENPSLVLPLMEQL